LRYKQKKKTHTHTNNSRGKNAEFLNFKHGGTYRNHWAFKV